MGWFSRLLDVPSTDPDDSRRRKLLNILLAGVWALAAAALVSVVLYRFTSAYTQEEPGLLIPSLGITLLGIMGIYAINRYWSGSVASWLFLLLLSTVLSLSDTPEEVSSGRSLFLFAIPILVASVLLKPHSSFIMAIVISVLVSLIAIQSGLSPDPITAIGFLTIALASWLSSRSLERALGDLRDVNQDLRESEDSYRTLFNSASDAIFIHDPSGKILEVNEVALESLGYRREEMLQMSLSDIEPLEQATLMAQRSQNLERKGTLLFESEYIRRDCSSLPVEVNSQLIEYGNHSAILNVARDITERRRVAELQERVQHHARLAAVGELAAGIAHDFNNLLAGILGLAELQLMNPDLPPEVITDLHNITQQAQRGAHLIKRILDFTRQSPSLQQNLDLVHFLHEMLSIFERTISENVHLTLEVGSGSFTVRCDPTQIQEALLNLIVNARDAMPDGGDLTISLRKIRVTSGHQAPLPDLQRGDWVCLAVSDTGTGIQPEIVPHLFEPFYTTKAPGRGTGLGLAQVYGIISQHNGQIGVDTQVGRGTTFTIYLPALTLEEKAHSPKEEQEIIWGHGESILVVEDELVVLETTRALLASLGYKVLTAKNGMEALQVLDARPGEIALVLSDLIMPGMGAEELYERLLERDGSTRMVVMSGYLSAEKVAELIAGGIDDWIHKPFSVEGLAQTVSHALST